MTIETYEIRETSCTGMVLCTVDLDVDERGYAPGPTGGRQGAIEVAASTAARKRVVTKRFGGPVSGLGINRETGTPGMSGIFSLRLGGAHKGQIHVTRA